MSVTGSRPLLISDCDEVLLHMIVPFRDWLDEAHHIHFDLVHGDWGEALRHKHDGTIVERGQVWELLNGFFDTEMHRQQAFCPRFFHQRPRQCLESHTRCV